MMRCRSASRQPASSSRAADARLQAFRHQGRDERRHVAAERRDLLDQARGDELVPLRCHEEHGFDLVSYFWIHWPVSDRNQVPGGAALMISAA